MSEEHEIYSLLVPLADHGLLIPRSNIIEVSALQPLDMFSASVPWLLGSMEWEGSLVPVVSFEGLCGNNIPDTGGNARIVLFRCLTDALDSRAFGVISQGFPQLLRVSEEVIETEDNPFAETQPVLCQVRVANQSLVIPDIERLEELIADAISISS